MTLVIDASVAAKWIFVEEGTDAARRLVEADETFAAPELVVAEIANIAWKRYRRGGAARDQAHDAAYAIVSVFGNLVPIMRLAPAALEMSMNLDHPIYDCFYLALAERDDIQMITADRRFHERVQGTPWQERVRLLGT